jgi:ABC-type sugar transport system permease subunit
MIDGAGTRTILTKIVLPMVWGTLSTILILKVAGLFTITGPILLLTGGAYDTQTLNFWFYKMVAIDGSYNIPAAGGIVFTLLGLPIVWGFRKLVNKFSDKLEY